MPERIPIIIRRFFALICARVGIIAVSVKINAVVSCVIENAVKNYADTAFFRFRYKQIERLVAAERFIDPHIVARIVFMI